MKAAHLLLAPAVAVIFLVGCSRSLMPTPNLYADGRAKPFTDVAPALQNNKVQVLYATDRAAEGKSPDKPEYGVKRSRSVAYGIAEVSLGNNVSWDDLVKASESRKRDVNLEMKLVKTTEFGRLPPTPRVLAQAVDMTSTRPAALVPEEDAEQQAADRAFMQLLSAQLARTPVKEVYLFVHGYNNSFEDATRTIAGLWHFLGREGVPIVYSWPAGYGGLLRGYTYDRESSEFSVYHLKQVLRLIARCPEVEKVNLIAHSRGTDTLTSALRELHLQISGSGRSTRQEMKLGSLVLAAPDMDFDVVVQRLMTIRLAQVPERFTMYICSNDQALGISSWLFGGTLRLGRLKSHLFTPAELKVLRDSDTVEIVDARVSDSGKFGHNYFHSNPAVSSDLILLMRYHRAPGIETGRPLRADPKGFWYVDDDYPAPQKK